MHIFRSPVIQNCKVRNRSVNLHHKWCVVSINNATNRLACLLYMFSFLNKSITQSFWEMTWQCSKNQSSQSTLEICMGLSLWRCLPHRQTPRFTQNVSNLVKLICLLSSRVTKEERPPVEGKGTVWSRCGSCIDLYNQYLTVSLCIVFPSLSSFFLAGLIVF